MSLTNDSDEFGTGEDSKDHHRLARTYVWTPNLVDLAEKSTTTLAALNSIA